MNKLSNIGILAFLLTASVSAEQICQRDSISASIPESRFKKENQSVVIDNQTGLMWAACIAGLTGKQCESGSPSLFTWGEALVYTTKVNDGEGLATFKDWRLPNIRELTSLVNTQCVKPSVDAESFPNTPASHTWTSSPYHSLTFYSWYVDFATGETNTDDRLNKKNIRLVRSIR